MNLMRWFPFLSWASATRHQVRRDIVAGVVVASVLVPQSMAYATLAGVPVIYGLYAATIPVIIAAMWGSSRFIHTGPVAMIALLSAAAVAPFAVLGSERFIEISIMLAFMVGIVQILLGLLRGSVLLNFISQPVIIGFTNAAALIIGLSLIASFVGVPRTRTDSWLIDLWRIFENLTELHWITLGFGVVAFMLLSLGPRLSKAAPWALMAVILGILFSATIGFERKQTVNIAAIDNAEARQLLADWRDTQAQFKKVMDDISGLPWGPQSPEENARRFLLEQQRDAQSDELPPLHYAVHALRLTPAEQGVVRFAESGETVWRPISVSGDRVVLSAGGRVVGEVPQALPAFKFPRFDLGLMVALLPSALIIGLFGFLMVTSISRTLAARSDDKQKSDSNAELVGQGLANVAGSMFQSFSVGGSFSRSAVGFGAHAATGMFAVISAIFVILTIVLLTPYMYHLPQAVLAAIVISAVFGLLNFRGLFDAWKINKSDAIAGFVTFFATLLLAPNLAAGVLVGIAVGVALFLVGTMKPRAEVQGQREDGTLAGISHGLPPPSQRFVVLRFDASLVFMNVAQFEESVLDALARSPGARAILVLGESINRLDATGAEAIRQLAADLAETGVALYFCALKKPVKQAFEAAGLIEELGEDKIFVSKDEALRQLKQKYDDEPQSAPSLAAQTP